MRLWLLDRLPPQVPRRLIGCHVAVAALVEMARRAQRTYERVVEATVTKQGRKGHAKAMHGAHDDELGLFPSTQRRSACISARAPGACIHGLLAFQQDAYVWMQVC